MRTKRVRKLAASRLRDIAVQSSTDPRTVQKYVAGDNVAPLCAARIERALATCGLQELIASAYAKRRTSQSSPQGTPSA